MTTKNKLEFKKNKKGIKKSFNFNFEYMYYKKFFFIKHVNLREISFIAIEKEKNKDSHRAGQKPNKEKFK